MWLVYRPTGKAVMLGKAYGDWDYVTDDVKERIEALFLHVSEHPEHNMNDFALAMEDSDSKFVLTDWKYSGETTVPLNTLEIKDTK